MPSVAEARNQYCVPLVRPVKVALGGLTVCEEMTLEKFTSVAACTV